MVNDEINISWGVQDLGLFRCLSSSEAEVLLTAFTVSVVLLWAVSFVAVFSAFQHEVEIAVRFDFYLST